MGAQTVHAAINFRT